MDLQCACPCKDAQPYENTREHCAALQHCSSISTRINTKPWKRQRFPCAAAKLQPKKTPILGKAGIGAHCASVNLPSKPIWGTVSIAGLTIEAEDHRRWGESSAPSASAVVRHFTAPHP